MFGFKKKKKPVVLQIPEEHVLGIAKLSDIAAATKPNWEASVILWQAVRDIFPETGSGARRLLQSGANIFVIEKKYSEYWK